MASPGRPAPAPYPFLPPSLLHGRHNPRTFRNTIGSPTEDPIGTTRMRLPHPLRYVPTGFVAP
eukprot:1345148-Pyramimonas_sp.AAC.1